LEVNNVARRRSAVADATQATHNHPQEAQEPLAALHAPAPIHIAQQRHVRTE
jgi:hypothetical protein